MKFDKLTNQELFEWLKTHPRDLRSGLFEIEERWLSFWEKVKVRIGRANKELLAIDDKIREIDEDLGKVERAVVGLQTRQKNLSKRRTNDRLRLVKNNLESIERQLKVRDPKPMIPESTWEAFEEFLIKLNGNKQ